MRDKPGFFSLQPTPVRLCDRWAAGCPAFGSDRLLVDIQTEFLHVSERDGTGVRGHPVAGFELARREVHAYGGIQIGVVDAASEGTAGRRVDGEGTSPGRIGVRRRFVGSGTGTAESNARVYAWQAWS